MPHNFVMRSKEKFCVNVKVNLRSPKGDLSLTGLAILHSIWYD